MLHRLTVPPEAADRRLDVWLEGRLDGCSRSLVTRLIKEGSCAISHADGRPIKPKAGYFLRGGEQVELEVPEIEPMEAVAEDIPLRVLHEDDHLIAIDKQPGMVVHPAVGHIRGTLVNALLGRYGDHFGGAPWRPGIVHRLDQDTSGVIVVARTPQALQALQAAFHDRVARKSYLALVHGSPRADLLEQAGWIGRHAKDFRKRAVYPAGTEGAKEAYTSFLIRHREDGYAVAEARPRSGRTHQIRVHLAALGHPVLADRVYGRSDRWPVSAADDDGTALRRQALHAWRLEVPHPGGGLLTLMAPIPEDLAGLIPFGLSPTPSR